MLAYETACELTDNVKNDINKWQFKNVWYTMGNIVIEINAQAEK